MTSSLTTALEELKRENDVLKTDNATMKDENKQLTTALDKMVVNNKDQVQQINSQWSSEIAIMKNENKQLRTNNATMMDEIVKLKTESDIIKAENVQVLLTSAGHYILHLSLQKQYSTSYRLVGGQGLHKLLT